MNEEDALLRAICDHPDDDTPRLVFADWLDEQGSEFNTAWAELIRVQVMLIRGGGSNPEPLLARERALEPAVVAGWPKRHGFPPWVEWKKWSRGFPLVVSGPWLQVCRARAVFANRVPLQEFNIEEVTDETLRWFVQWPELRLVRRLSMWIGPSGITDRGLGSLAGCASLCRLEQLWLERVYMNVEGALALLDSRYLARISNLQMVADGLYLLNEEVCLRMRERFPNWRIR